MSSNPSGWTWDPTRQKYFYFSPAENCYVYADGERIAVAPATHAPLPTPLQYHPSPVQAPYAQPTITHPTTYGPSASTHPSGAGAYDSEQSLQQRFIRGTTGSHESLDPRYKVRRASDHFFKPGRIFRILWSEPAGPNRGTVLSDGPFSGEAVHTKIRWFAVLQEGPGYSSCLPIQTYEGKGVGKPSVVKSHHGIIHTSSKPPKPAPEEKVSAGEEGMQPPIKVTPRSKGDKMDPMSRINYNKIYPVEHNVKVYDFGTVAKESKTQFVLNFKEVFSLPELSDQGEEQDDDTVEEGSLAVRGRHTAHEIQEQLARLRLANVEEGEEQDDDNNDDNDEEDEDEEGEGDSGYAGVGTGQLQHVVDAQHNQSVQGWVTHLKARQTPQHDQMADYLLHAPREDQINYIKKLVAATQTEASAESSKGKGKGKGKQHRRP
ncbi:hypothetical protein NA57DRAFT_70406 [Rhizodiscina lignyota]|uniref:DUF6590 domain-containing protein n=1 Tax=Rhizodiscina lignyota TaxID=1504668 RepID=A0A9P4IN60_9PEZI|nr:hypothetical protein NA57DRAFT_70406 [Rhizodiscina lignyota]